MLLDKGAEPNKADIWGRTSLHYAAMYDKKEMAKLLLDHGADGNKADEDGKTPLSHAIEKGHQDVVKIMTGQEPQANPQRHLCLLQVLLMGFIGVGYALLLKVAYEL